MVLGNLKQLFGLDTLPWHWEMVRRYGGAFKYYGLFGVNIFYLYNCLLELLTLGLRKDEQVYVTDAKALHHIVVKDQYIYEETSMFIE